MKKIELAARLCHEVNRNWCALNGDMSQPAWEDAPDWQKNSAILGVQFHMDNPDAGDSASHDSWMAQKVADGWIYGEIKDPDATPPTHHCMVPFDQLPEVDQIKDALFRSTVHSVMGIQSGDSDEAISDIHPAPLEFTEEQLQTDHILRYFHYAHLPEKLQSVSRPFCELAGQIVINLPRNPERTVALRKMLEAKDAAVRANVT